MNGGVVYFIGTSSEEDPIKVGYSALPADRLACFQAGSPKKLMIHAFLRCAPQFERCFHIRYEKFRLWNEWFERNHLMDEDMELIISGKFKASILPTYFPQPPKKPDGTIRNRKKENELMCSGPLAIRALSDGWRP